MSIRSPNGPAEASHASVLAGERGIVATWRSNVLVHPNAFHGIFTMTGNRACLAMSRVAMSR